MIIGIDLGTTNCAVGIWRDGKADLIPNSLGHRLTPSAVSIDEKTGDILVGLPARERQTTHPDLTVTAFKRYMGSTRRTRLGKQEFLPEELSALVLRRLKADAEAYLGEPVTEAVITVPAYFNDKQRKATRRAGELAGLKVERLLNEPTAAALAYGIHELANESRFMVFDLGGGTFDISVLEIFDGVIEVRASTGDNRLGGEDFNTVLIEGFCGLPGVTFGGHARSEPKLRERLRDAAERARRALTEQSPVRMSLTWDDKPIEAEITSEMFEKWCEPLIERLREPVVRALRDCNLRPDQLQELVLVGGSTRMPVVRRAATRMFGRFASHRVHPDEAVAIGAAVQAGLKSRDVALKDVVLTDVCPYSLGVEAQNRGPDGTPRGLIFIPIIERNTIIPASRVDYFSTSTDDQTKVDIRIFQGESLRPTDNVLLGHVTVPVPPGPAGKVGIEVRFTYDINGLLLVEVTVPQTGERRELTIVEDEALTPAEIEAQKANLAKLKQHPRDNDANRHAMARAERCFEDMLGDRRDFVGRLIRQFEDALDSQDPRTAEHARQALNEQLDALEGETWL